MNETSKSQMPAEDFLRGLLAALAVENHKLLPASQPQIHRAFYRVVKELKKPETKSVLDVDLLDVDYDPLYGQSRWFDRAIARAQRNLIVSFPNPTYNNVFIRYEPDEGDRILDALGPRSTFKRLADLFFNELTDTSTQQSTAPS